MYINQGRFGEFVQKFLESEYERKKAKADEDREWKLWIAYIHSYSEESFGTWKSLVDKTDNQNATKGNDENLDDNGIMSIINELFPESWGETQ